MRIPRPRRPTLPFRRARAPPPQATKLLRYSMISVLLFVIILAIVFIPRFVEYGSPCRSTSLELAIESGRKISVRSAAVVLERAAFRAVLLRDNGMIASLQSGLTNGTAALNFTDANGDDAVGPGDYFTVDASEQGRYRLEVRLVDLRCDDRLVGLREWTGALS